MPSTPDIRPDAQQAFRALWRLHADGLKRYARRIVRSREVAEDIVQDVFLRLWLARDRVDFGDGTRSYLYITTRARALNELRRSRTEARVHERVRPHGILRDEPMLPPPAESRVEGDEITAAVEQVLAGMPPRQRAVAALRLRQQHSTAEIAGALGLSPRTVELYVGRATRTLRERLPLLLGEAPANARPSLATGARGDGRTSG